MQQTCICGLDGAMLVMPYSPSDTIHVGLSLRIEVGWKYTQCASQVLMNVMYSFRNKLRVFK